jgi:hypothetical protein
MSESRPPYHVRPEGDAARDYGFLDADPVPLKVWLPETVETMVEELARQRQQPKSALISQLLFAHLYGWHDLEVLLARTGGRLVNAPLEAESRSPGYRVELGKSIADVRVFVAPRMKADLERLAQARGLKLSAYARRVVLDNILGQVPHPSEIPTQRNEDE